MNNSIAILQLSTDETALELVTVMDAYESAFFSRSWSEYGKFQIQIKVDAPSSGELTRGRFVMFGNDTKSIGIILERVQTTGATASDKTITITGREAKTLLSRRLVKPLAGNVLYTVTGPGETVIKTTVNQQLGVGVADTNRWIEVVKIATDQARGASYILSSEYGKLNEEITKASKASGVGFWFELDTSDNTLLLECDTGTDRTVSQSSNPRAIFAEKYDTIASGSITDSDIEYRNWAVIASGEDKDTGLKTYAETTNEGATPAGIYRREVFVDGSQYPIGDLAAYGVSQLDTMTTTAFIDGQILTVSSLMYRRDYDLGDIVSVQIGNYSYDARITEVKENWAAGRYEVNIIFDDPYPEN